MKIKLLLITLALNTQISSKVRLLTFHYNRPDFIEIQKKCFDKFLLEDYELIVFNDASNPIMEKEISDMCQKLGLECIRFDQTKHNETYLTREIESWFVQARRKKITGIQALDLKGKHPSVRHCHVIQYALDNFGYNHNDIVGLIDGDMFLIRPFSIRHFMGQSHLMGTRKTDETKSVEFIWVALAFIDMPKLENRRSLRFNITLVNNHITDSGGESHIYIKNHPNEKITMLPKYNLSDYKKWGKNKLTRAGFSEDEIFFIKNNKYNAEFHMNDHFMHYTRSSFVKSENKHAHETLDFHNEKSEFFLSFFEKILKD